MNTAIRLSTILLVLAPHSLMANAEGSPRVVELFTSQGCSSCPPADQVLSQLNQDDNVIAISWHVDYWNRLGWKDPFSDSAYSTRQQRYAQTFGLRSVYTPQMVIDGREQFVGSDSREAKRLLKADVPRQTVSISLTNVRIDEGAIRANLHLESDGELLDVRVLAVVTEDKLTTQSIPRGENRGKTLTHDGVARHVVEFDPKKTLAIRIPMNEEWVRANLNLVILIESKADRRIEGAARVRLANLR